MSKDVNTRIIERAVELAEDLRMPYYDNEVSRLVLAGDLDELFELCKAMTEIKQHQGMSEDEIRDWEL